MSIECTVFSETLRIAIKIEAQVSKHMHVPHTLLVQ